MLAFHLYFLIKTVSKGLEIKNLGLFEEKGQLMFVKTLFGKHKILVFEAGGFIFFQLDHH